MDAGARGARAGSCVSGYGTTVLNLSTDPGHGQGYALVDSKGHLLPINVRATLKPLRSPLCYEEASDVRVFGREVEP